MATGSIGKGRVIIMKKLINLCTVLLCFGLLFGMASCKSESKPESYTSESELEKNFRLLKNGDSKALIGLNVGEVADLSLIEKVEDSYDVFKIKDERYGNIDLYLSIDRKSTRLNSSH